MPQIVPVSDFRTDIGSVAKYTDAGEIVVLTQNGRPRWAMIDYDEWNAAAAEQERACALELDRTQHEEESGRLEYASKDKYLEHVQARRISREVVA